MGVSLSDCITRHGCVCVLCPKWPVTNGLPRQNPPTTQSLGCRGHPISSARSREVICYKHMTHLDSLDNPNESKLPPPSPFLAGIPQMLTSCSDSWNTVIPDRKWLVVSASPIYAVINQPYRCLCVILKRFWVQIWSATLLQLRRLRQLMMSHATQAHVCDPRDLFSQGGRMQWAQAS